jgi:hypothetical protein
MLFGQVSNANGGIVMTTTPTKMYAKHFSAFMTCVFSFSFDFFFFLLGIGLATTTGTPRTFTFSLYLACLLFIQEMNLDPKMAIFSRSEILSTSVCLIITTNAFHNLLYPIQFDLNVACA